MKYKVFNLNPSFGTNTYLAWDEATLAACLIDPSAAGEEILQFIQQHNLKVNYIINTHAHYDHIGGNKFFQEKLNIPIYASPAAAAALVDPQKNLSSYVGNQLISPAAAKTLADNEILDLGEAKIRIIHTPGHTRGGISLYCQPLLFSGDTLFAESVGRADLPGGNMSILIKSIKEKLFCLPETTQVLSGHGPASTIGDEKVGNPYVGLAARL
jgi:glyoxylase-like metal-dependent hydrolase (beta-lactamase superfamily II)